MDIKDLKELYKEKELEIASRLQDFKKVPEDQWKFELLFCILTPQSNAKKCWQAIQELKQKNFQEIEKTLSTKTRFHRNKTKYIQQVLEKWPVIQSTIKETSDPVILRNYLYENIKGLGLKESSHVIRNLGKSNNQLAILDRHILRNLAKYKVIQDPNITLSKKNYLNIEKQMINFSKHINIPLDALDLLFWSQGTGMIFK